MFKILGVNNNLVNSANGNLVRGEVTGLKARLSPDSGRESDKTDSDTSNSYPCDKNGSKSLASQTNSHQNNVNGLPPGGYNIQVT